MSITIVIHTENKEKLLSLFKIIERNPRKRDFSIYLHAKDYIPWNDITLKNYIVNFSRYSAFPTQKSKIESIIEILTKIGGGDILLFDENCKSFSLNYWDINNNDYLFTKKKELMDLNLDSKYSEIKSFIIDLNTQKNKKIINFDDGSEDSLRYNKKINNPLFYERIIFIDGGLGDHVLALPLLEKIGKNVYVSCKYPHMFEHLSIKGFIQWTDELFGGYKRFVYEYGSANSSKTLVDAFFEMYGIVRKPEDILIYNGKREPVEGLPANKRSVLICTSAAKIQGLDSNKDWKDIRWMKLVHELQKQNYFVIQVGTSSDTQIPNVDMKFLNEPLSKLATLIQRFGFWISVDTFFHHFASAINPKAGICLTPFYNDHAKHPGVTYIEKDCGKNYYDRRWWLDLQQPERKECMDLIQVEDVLDKTLYVGMGKPENEINLKNIKTVNNRTEMLEHLSKKLLTNPVCLELGVLNGDFSSEILKILNPEKLYLVDPWIIGSDKHGETMNYGNGMGNLPTSYSATDEYNRVIEKFTKEINEKKVIIKKGFSYDMIDEFPDNYFDFIYLDACHLYGSVKWDLTHYFSKLKKDGFICGDDYVNFYNFGVIKAVTEFCKENNLEIELLSRDSYSWVLIPKKNQEIKKKTTNVKVKIYCSGKVNIDNTTNWRAYLQYYGDIENVEFTFSDKGGFNMEDDKKHNVVMLLRPIDKYDDYFKWLRSNGIKVIVDYDDPFPLYPESDGILNQLTVVLNAIKECDVITTTTERLKDYYYRYTGKSNIMVIPNIINNNIVSNTKKDNGEKIILGWFGTWNHLHNLEKIKDLVIRILNEYNNVYLNLYTESSEISVLFEHKQTNIVSYIKEYDNFQESIGDIDINLSPINEDYFCLHKSNIRIILPGYKGIPSVATNFGEYKDIGRKNVILCDTEDDWYIGIKKLINDIEFRKQIGNNIKDYVDKNFTFDVWKHKKSEFFTNLLKK